MTFSVRAATVAAAVRVRRFVLRHPFAVGLGALLVVTGLAFGTLWGEHPDWLGASPLTLGRERQWWTPVTALLVPDSWGELIIALVLALTLLAYAERLMGTLRTGLVFLVSGALGVLVGVGVQTLAWSWGQIWARVDARGQVFDPSVGIIGAVMAGSAYAPALYRRRIRLIGFSLLLTFTLYGGDSDSVYRLFSALIGLIAGVILTSGHAKAAWHRSSYRETRTLIAAMVAVTGLGPLIVLITGVGTGPLAPVIAGLRGIDISGIVDSCADAASDRCVTSVSTAVAAGTGYVLMSLVPLLLSLVAAWGLRSGRRAAWFLAMGVNTVMALLTGISVAVRELTHPADVVTIDRQFPGFSVLAILIPVAMCVLLAVTHRRFAVRASGRAVARFAAIIGIAFVVLVGADMMLVMNATHSASFWPTFGGTLRRFLPTGIGHPGSRTTLVGLPRALHRDVGGLFWLVFAAAMLGLLRGRSMKTADETDRFRAQLRETDGGTLGFMGTWEGNDHWFTRDGRGAVAYRVVSDIAIAVGDPVCLPGDAERTIRGFLDFCDSNAWTAVFYSTHEEYAPAFRGLGWKRISVAEETVVPLERFELTGKVWAKVRQPYNRGQRDGLTTLWTTWEQLPAGLVVQLDALSEQWIAEKALPEMRFTLGGMEELRDPDVAILLAIGPEGELQAVTSWMPVWREGELIGRTLDFMRRADGAMPGVMEFAIASAALHMKDLGLQVMSLSGAPLAQTADGGDDESNAIKRLLGWLSRVLEPAYGFASLLRYKGKFNPDYRPMYLFYADNGQLPAIGLAIGRAYLPNASPAEYMALARSLAG
ncbi:bifunctional lysylphosphatidylglycerol flippase/synthetase MprF [Microbacterium sp. 22242]|uniref:bifunctional lysylphosphatidylglycerol flippase/synthetase MprF n=1 Tax=Microbacterium sp. 22242 TaxID=3453896 RepID=UPI003F82D2DA